MIDDDPGFSAPEGWVRGERLVIEQKEVGYGYALIYLSPLRGVDDGRDPTIAALWAPTFANAVRFLQWWFGEQERTG
jgi:hypothetical protein